MKTRMSQEKSTRLCEIIVHSMTYDRFRTGTRKLGKGATVFVSLDEACLGKNGRPACRCSGRGKPLFVEMRSRNTQLGFGSNWCSCQTVLPGSIHSKACSLSPDTICRPWTNRPIVRLRGTKKDAARHQGLRSFQFEEGSLRFTLLDKHLVAKLFVWGLDEGQRAALLPLEFVNQRLLRRRNG